MTDLVPTPVIGTWQSGQLASAAWLNANVRDAQRFLAYAPLTIVTRAATQSINGSTNTPVQWDTEVIDGDGMFTAPDTKLYARRAGIYDIQFEPHFVGNTGGTIRAGHIALNGSGNWVGSCNNAPSGSAFCGNCSAIVAMKSGDYVEGYVYQSSGGGALNCGGGYNAPRMSVRLISTAALDVNYENPTPPPSPPPTPDNPTHYENTYYATWSRSYDGDNGTTWDDSPYCYQGYYSSARGNTKSLVGFNGTTIRSDLSGATNIQVKLYFKVAHAYYSAGITAVVGSHTQSSKPGSAPTSPWYYDEKRVSAVKEGNTYYVDFGVNNWVGWAWQNNVIQGHTFGPGPNTTYSYYGYMYGATQGGKPYLKISYWK